VHWNDAPEAEPTLSVELLERSHETIHGRRNQGLRLRGRPKRRGPRVRQLVVDVAPHSLDLSTHRLRQRRLARRFHTVGIGRQHGKRRLQTVGEISGSRDRAGDSVFAFHQELIERGDERLHFRRVLSVDPFPVSKAQFSHASAERVHGPKPSANRHRASEHAQETNPERERHRYGKQ
jgi:hypothetical protein